MAALPGPSASDAVPVGMVGIPLDNAQYAAERAVGVTAQGDYGDWGDDWEDDGIVMSENKGELPTIPMRNMNLSAGHEMNLSTGRDERLGDVPLVHKRPSDVPIPKRKADPLRSPDGRRHRTSDKLGDGQNDNSDVMQLEESPADASQTQTLFVWQADKPRPPGTAHSEPFEIGSMNLSQFTLVSNRTELVRKKFGDDAGGAYFKRAVRTGSDALTYRCTFDGVHFGGVMKRKSDENPVERAKTERPGFTQMKHDFAERIHNITKDRHAAALCMQRISEVGELAFLSAGGYDTETKTFYGSLSKDGTPVPEGPRRITMEDDNMLRVMVEGIALLHGNSAAERFRDRMLRVGSMAFVPNVDATFDNGKFLGVLQLPEEIPAVVTESKDAARVPGAAGSTPSPGQVPVSERLRAAQSGRRDYDVDDNHVIPANPAAARGPLVAQKAADLVAKNGRAPVLSTELIELLKASKIMPGELQRVQRVVRDLGKSRDLEQSARRELDNELSRSQNDVRVRDDSIRTLQDRIKQVESERDALQKEMDTHELENQTVKVHIDGARHNADVHVAETEADALRHAQAHTGDFAARVEGHEVAMMTRVDSELEQLSTETHKDLLPEVKESLRKRIRAVATCFFVPMVRDILTAQSNSDRQAARYDREIDELKARLAAVNVVVPVPNANVAPAPPSENPEARAKVIKLEQDVADLQRAKELSDNFVIELTRRVGEYEAGLNMRYLDDVPLIGDRVVNVVNVINGKWRSSVDVIAKMKQEHDNQQAILQRISAVVNPDKLDKRELDKLVESRMKSREQLRVTARDMQGMHARWAKGIRDLQVVDAQQGIHNVEFIDKALVRVAELAKIADGWAKGTKDVTLDAARELVACVDQLQVQGLELRGPTEALADYVRRVVRGLGDLVRERDGNLVRAKVALDDAVEAARVLRADAGRQKEQLEQLNQDAKELRANAEARIADLDKKKKELEEKDVALAIRNKDLEKAHAERIRDIAEELLAVKMGEGDEDKRDAAANRAIVGVVEEMKRQANENLALRLRLHGFSTGPVNVLQPPPPVFQIDGKNMTQEEVLLALKQRDLMQLQLLHNEKRVERLNADHKAALGLVEQAAAARAEALRKAEEDRPSEPAAGVVRQPRVPKAGGSDKPAQQETETINTLTRYKAELERKVKQLTADNAALKVTDGGRVERLNTATADLEIAERKIQAANADVLELKRKEEDLKSSLDQVERRLRDPFGIEVDISGDDTLQRNIVKCIQLEKKDHVPIRDILNGFIDEFGRRQRAYDRLNTDGVSEQRNKLAHIWADSLRELEVQLETALTNPVYGDKHRPDILASWRRLVEDPFDKNNITGTLSPIVAYIQELKDDFLNVYDMYDLQLGDARKILGLFNNFIGHAQAALKGRNELEAMGAIPDPDRFGGNENANVGGGYTSALAVLLDAIKKAVRPAAPQLAVEPRPERPEPETWATLFRRQRPQVLDGDADAVSSISNPIMTAMSLFPPELLLTMEERAASLFHTKVNTAVLIATDPSHIQTLTSRIQADIGNVSRASYGTGVRIITAKDLRTVGVGFPFAGHHVVLVPAASASMDEVQKLLVASINVTRAYAKSCTIDVVPYDPHTFKVAAVRGGWAHETFTHTGVRVEVNVNRVAFRQWRDVCARFRWLLLSRCTAATDRLEALGIDDSVTIMDALGQKLGHDFMGWLPIPSDSGGSQYTAERPADFVRQILAYTQRIKGITSKANAAEITAIAESDAKRESERYKSEQTGVISLAPPNGSDEPVFQLAAGPSGPVHANKTPHKQDHDVHFMKQRALERANRSSNGPDIDAVELTVDTSGSEYESDPPKARRAHEGLRGMDRRARVARDAELMRIYEARPDYVAKNHRFNAKIHALGMRHGDENNSGPPRDDGAIPKGGIPIFPAGGADPPAFRVWGENTGRGVISQDDQSGSNAQHSLFTGRSRRSGRAHP